MSTATENPNGTIPVLITARIGSTRLPGKHMLPICGKPVIEHMITRIKHAQSPDKYVICTTDLPEDDVFKEVASRCNTEIFRGHPTDILKRWLDCADYFKARYFISAEADDVFCDPDYIDVIVRELVKGEYDYITCKGLPFGVTPTGIKVSALRKICEMKMDDDTQGQERYFTKSGLFKVKNIYIDDPEIHNPDIRMTLDYQEDYLFFKTIFERFYPKQTFFTLREILRLLKEHPEIIRINEEMQETYRKRYNSLYGSLNLKNTKI